MAQKTPGKVHIAVIDDEAIILQTFSSLMRQYGITFVKRVRFVLPDLPIVFMTGGVPDNVREEAMSFKNVLFLEKPFPLDTP